MKVPVFKNLAVVLLLFTLSSCGGGVAPSEAGPPQPASGDGGMSLERQMAALIRGHSKQKRTSLVWDSRLASAARARATDMGRRKYFNHVDPDGFGPNYHVTKAGYRLPIKWTAFDGSNQVESILAGNSSAYVAFKKWMGSKRHADHILALKPFYGSQTRFGVGFAYVSDSPYKHYWVFLSAPPEE